MDTKLIIISILVGLIVLVVLFKYFSGRSEGASADTGKHWTAASAKKDAASSKDSKGISTLECGEYSKKDRINGSNVGALSNYILLDKKSSVTADKVFSSKQWCLRNRLRWCGTTKKNSCKGPPLTPKPASASSSTTTPAKPITTVPAAPAKPTTPAAPAKPTTPAAPAKPTTPAAPAKPTTPAAPAKK